MTVLQKTIESINKLDDDVDRRTARQQARERISHLVMPHRALGRLLDLAEDLTEMTGHYPPQVNRKTIVVMAADHGVTEEGVSEYPKEVTGQMVQNFIAGRAGINVLARQANARVVVVDMGLETELVHLIAEGSIISKRIGSGTDSIVKGRAMDRNDAVRCIEAGIDVALSLASEVDLFGTGDMGIGNTTPSSAIVSAICQISPDRVTGRGTGIDDAKLSHKVRVIEKALSRNQPDPSDGIDILSKIGGFEIGGIAGLILGAASCGKPIVIDGFISTAGALIAQMLAPASVQMMISAHKSREIGHQIALDRLKLQPLLDLDLRLGEGTGAALAMHLIDTAVLILTQMASFEEAKVSKAIL